MAEIQYKFLNDRPVKEDAIGHYQIIADQLFETIHCNLDKPFVVGLFGSWGTGKSSIIEMLEARCNQEKGKKTKLVVVDAWRKEKSIFNRQFLKKVARELFGKDTHFDTVRKAVDEIETKSTSNWKPSPLAWFLFAMFVLGFIACTVIAIWGWYNQKGETNPFPWESIAGSVVGILVACYFQLILPRFSIGTTAEVNDVSVHDIDHFRDIYFDKIIRKTDAQRVCIVIDNLDRVEAEDALTIMQMLKTFIVDAKEDKGTSEEVKPESLNKVVFILPCCDKELKEHIEKSGAVKDGAEFLQKLFNVSFRIPEFRLQDAFQYTRNLLYEMGLDFDENHKSTICHIVSKVYGKNPRKAKIFLNNFLMRYKVAKVCEEAGKIQQGVVTDHPDWLAIYIANEEMGSSADDYIRRLLVEISPASAAGMKFLKRPNDFDKISGLYELLDIASRNDKGFSSQISERVSESQIIIDAIWRNVESGDYRSQANIVASVVSAIAENEQISISPWVTNQMASFIAWQFPQDLAEDMPGKLVYERILKGKMAEVTTAAKNLGQIVNGRRCSDGQIKYSVDLIEAILADVETLYRKSPVAQRTEFEQEIINAINRIVEFDLSVVPIALRYPQYKSEKIFTKSVKMCSIGDVQIIPDNLVAYSISLDESSDDGAHNYIKKTMEAFNSALRTYCNKDKWSGIGVPKNCTSLLKSLRTMNTLVYGYNMSSTESVTALHTLNDLFAYVDDDNKLEIIEAFKDYEGFSKWPEIKNIALIQLNTKGGELMTGGSEKIVCLFIKRNHELVNQRLAEFINRAANRYKNLCSLILNEYPERRESVIPEIWTRNSEWVSEWVKESVSKIDRVQKQKLQRILFGIANSKGHPIGAYQAISYVKIGNDKEALDARTKHFDNLIKSKELSKIDDLEFVLERIDKAAYVTIDEQNILLNKGWRGIDQDTAGENLKRLVKKVIRL
jgi:hypothetical protein